MILILCHVILFLNIIVIKYYQAGQLIHNIVVIYIIIIILLLLVKLIVIGVNINIIIIIIIIIFIFLNILLLYILYFIFYQAGQLIHNTIWVVNVLFYFNLFYFILLILG